MFKNKSHRNSERVIVDGRIVDLTALRDEAKSAGTRFWVLLVLVSLISSMVVPYLSMASVVAANSQVFDSEMVIPGYSMGGIDITTYGVDINSWGQTPAQNSSNPHIVQSTYGYWTKDRAENASKNLVASQKADKDRDGEKDAPLSGFSVDDTMMDPAQKAKGWIGITRDNGEGAGLSDFHSYPSGVVVTDRSSYSESVAPYRTEEDWRFWDSRTVGGSEASMTTTIYPDFVVLGWNEQTQTARVLSNPDSIENPTSAEGGKDTSQSGAIKGTMAVPRYVPLSTLFAAYDLDKTVMGKDGMNDMDALLKAIGEDARAHDGKATKLNEIVKNSSDAKNNLLVGTHYENLNGKDRSREPGSDAWNPYPYSMVFHATTNNGMVVSSIYNNTEAYAYLSPYSAYTNYMSLRSEYDELVQLYANLVAGESAEIAFQLGYYLAGMSILEAYLNDALPQDMTRGYVGPAEGNPIANEKNNLENAKKLDTRSGDSGTVSALFKDGLKSVDGGNSALGFKSVAYSQLMYDFADAAIAKYSQKGETSKLGMTSAIMNTLSTYGYGTKDSGSNVSTASASAGQGPMRGMTRKQAMAKVTSFGPYSNSAKSLDMSNVKDADDPITHPDASSKANTGIYVPGYYPVQQHEMPISEMAYRFQVVADIPYETVTHELAAHGFSSGVTLSYKNDAIENLSSTKDYYNKAASLSQQLNDIDSATPGVNLSGWDAKESILLNPEKQTAMVGEQATKAFSNAKDLTTRVDNAFLAFKQGKMNADNVHDMVDLVRAIPGVKYETFMRYYNPLKSSGGADDIFLTRITPAQTAYMPKMLTAGYESAGGMTNNSNITLTSNANFNYFSIPSLSPCLAAKTADNTFYGALNYELRPFYTEGFLANLPANANIPALEKYESLTNGDGKDEQTESDTTIDGIKDKVATIYVLAKRLAFASAYGRLMDSQNGSEGTVTLGALHYGGLQSNVVASKNQASIKAALDPKDKDKYIGQENDKGNQGISKKKTNKKVTKKKKTSTKGSAKTGKGAQAIVDTAELAYGNGNSVSLYTQGDNDPFRDSSGRAALTVEEMGTTNGILNLHNTDCSGLAMFCLFQTGEYDKSEVGFHKLGVIGQSNEFINDSRLTQVACADRQPGDIVQTPSKGHVAIYVGNDTFIEHVGPEGSGHIAKGPWSEEQMESYVWLRLKSATSSSGSSKKNSSVATGIVTSPADAISGAVARAYQVDSGDLVTTTGADTQSQRVATYENDRGGVDAVAYVRQEEGWAAQAESTQTTAPSAQANGGTQADASTNGIPSQAPATSGVPDVPATNSASGSQAAPAASDATPNVADSAKNGDAGGATGSDANGTTQGGSEQGSPSPTAVPEDNSPYADNGGEADKIYTNDHLAQKGFLKASKEQWDAIKETHSVNDGISYHIPSGMKFSAEGDFDYVMQKFGQKHILPDDVLGKKTIWCKDSNGYAFVTNVKTLFTGLYNDAFNELLVPAGTYYWDSAKNIAGYGANLDGIDVKGDDEKTEHNTVALEYAKAGNAGVARETIDAYCQKAFGNASEVWKNMKALNDELPQQMQNVLAWADNQTTTESESNYLPDNSESNPNLIITIGNKRIDAPSIGIIRSLADLESASFEIADNGGDWTAVPVVTDKGKDGKEGEGTAQEDDLQSRMTRGVANTTSTASGNLAAYTMSATIGRIDSIVSSTSSTSSIPYSGICSGNLTAGTDRYAQLQSHSIDHEGISSRTTGDLRSRASVGTDVAIASSTTDASTQQAISKAANLVNEFSSSSIPASIDVVTDAFASVLPDSGTNKTLQSSTSAANAGPIFGNSAQSQTMAMTSTFDSVTMNRRSAASLTAEPSTGMLVPAAGGSATASAATGLSWDREIAKSLVSGAFSDAYSVIQSLALIMVLMFLMVIAFQNFIAYSNGKEDDYIMAQSKLKTVLPRSLIAVAMIGLPPLGGGVGFQGGCFLLLQVINTIMDATLGVFTQGASTTALLSQIGSCLTVEGHITAPWDIDLFSTLLGLLAVALFMIGSAIVILIILLTDIFLFAFWAIGPVMWAFYVWPYSGSQKPPADRGIGKFLTTLTGKMGIKTFSGKSMGNEAPMGWVFGYMTTLATVAGWNMMFWIAGVVFEKLRPADTAVTIAGQDGHVSSPTIVSGETADEFLNGARGLFDTPAGGLILVVIFLALVYLMFVMMKGCLGGAAGIVYRGVGGALGTVRQYVGGVASELGTVDKGTMEKRLANGMLTKGMSEERRKKMAAALTSQSAVHIGNAARAVNAGTQDAGERIRRVANTLTTPVAQREATSGAFDDLITVEDETVETIDRETGELVTTRTGKKKLGFSPVLSSVPGAIRDSLALRKSKTEESLQRAQGRIEEIDAQDKPYRDLQRIDQLHLVAENCVESGSIDRKSMNFRIQRTIDRYNKAMLSNDTETMEKRQAHLEKQVAALGMSKGDAGRLLEMSVTEREAVLADAADKTERELLRGDYAQELMAKRDNISLRHAELDAKRGVQEAIVERAQDNLAAIEANTAVSPRTETTTLRATR